MNSESLLSPILKELSFKLALNAINISAGEFLDFKSIDNASDNEGSLPLNRAEVYEKILTKEAMGKVGESNDLYRCVVVVGAGVSHNVCKHHKLGKEFAEELKNTFMEKSSSMDKDTNLIEAELQRLQRIYKLDPKEFETVLYAISKYYPQELRDKLKERYDYRYNPGLTYEILAHLMKHRFVDAIINFNFDEMLDQSIEDELKPDEYYKVIFDGDANVEKIFHPDEGLRYPIYIKPHGTISHESSLRFTEEAYYGLPKSIEHLLKKLLSAKIELLGKVEQMKIILICIGFNMQSTEFNVLLNQELPKGSEIYFIKRSPDPPAIDPRPLDLNGWGKPHLEARAKASVITINNKGLDGTIEDFWNAILSNFENFKPRGIQRHLLIAKLFNIKDKPREKGSEGLKDYFWQRACVEFALSVAKYKGFVCLNQLEEDRFGKYFREALKNPSEGAPSNSLKMIEWFGFDDWSYGGKAFTFKDIQEEREADEGKPDSSLTIERDLFFPPKSSKTSFCDKILEKLRNEANGIFNRKLTEVETALFKETLEALYDSEDTEISPKYNNLYGQMFTAPDVVKTRLGLDLKTQQYLEQEDWNVLYVVAETGEWLYNAMKRLRNDFVTNREINLIYADESKFVEDLRVDLENHGCTFKSYYLPWWLHNQHMTIYLKKEPEDPIHFQVLRAVYFTRRLRASNINPILLEKRREDCKMLVETFEAYMLKSENLKNGIGNEVSKQKITEAREKYLWGYSH